MIGLHLNQRLVQFIYSLSHAKLFTIYLKSLLLGITTNNQALLHSHLGALKSPMLDNISILDSARDVMRGRYFPAVDEDYTTSREYHS